MLLIKCLNRDGTTHRGFIWPKSGPVSPDNWSREATCESAGLFGVEDGLKAKVVPAEEGELPEVIYHGDLWGAFGLIHEGRMAWILWQDLASNGIGSTAANSGDRSNPASSGEGSTAVAVGNSSKAACGPNGFLAVEYWDGGRRRLAVGYSGEDGIQPGRWYQADVAGKLVGCGPVDAAEEVAQ